MFNLIQDQDVIERVIASAVLFAVFIIVRIISAKGIRNWKTSNADLKRRWMVQIKNVSFVILLLGLLVIWATQLRTFALSMVAIAAALAISTKEMILCFVGGMYKASARPFEVGDRIDLGPHRGDVIDHDFISTTLLEIGPGRDMHQYTGRQIVIPNSIFLTTAVYNESATSKYVLHVFTVPIFVTDDWETLQKLLLECANEVVAPFVEDARQFLQNFGQVEGIDAPNPTPRVSIKFNDAEQINFIVRVVAQPDRTGTIEQAIVKKFLQRRPPPKLPDYSSQHPSK